MFAERALRDIIDTLCTKLGDLSFESRIGVWLSVFTLSGNTSFLTQFVLQFYLRANGFVANFYSFDEAGFFKLLAFTFHHHNILIGRGYYNINVGFFDLAAAWVHNIFAIDTAYTNLRYNFLDRNVAHCKCRRCCETRKRVGHNLCIRRNKRYQHLYFAQVIIREQWTKCTVYKT